MLISMDPFGTDLEHADALQNLLLSFSTGGGGEDADYKELRQYFVGNPAYAKLLPGWVRTCRDLQQFWSFIKGKFGTYAERRKFIWEEFAPLLQHLEDTPPPADATITAGLMEFSPSGVHDIWQRALARRDSDPEGAITLAKSLLESVMKHILDERDIAYSDKADLPDLYRLTAKELNLAPNQHTQENFKRILGGISSIVGELGSLRNRLGDAHGQGKRMVRPAIRHAELAVNLAGSAALFLIETAKQ